VYLERALVERDLLASPTRVSATRELLAEVRVYVHCLRCDCAHTRVQLPVENYMTARELFRLLHHVADEAAHNRMSAANIAIVFAPLLLRPLEESFETTLK
jgi:hypothetical protein